MNQKEHTCLRERFIGMIVRKKKKATKMYPQREIASGVELE